MPYNPKRANGKWLARAKRGGKTYCLGYFVTYDEAWAAEMAFAEIYPPLINYPRQKTDPSKPKPPKTPFPARRYRDGKYIHLGSFTTAKEARAVEAAFDAENPRKKPGPNPHPDRPMSMRNRYAY